MVNVSIFTEGHYPTSVFDLTEEKFADTFFGDEGLEIALDEEYGSYYKTANAYIFVSEEGTYSISLLLYAVETDEEEEEVETPIDEFIIEFEAKKADLTALREVFETIEKPEDFDYFNREVYLDRQYTLMQAAEGYLWTEKFISASSQQLIDKLTEELKLIAENGFIKKADYSTLYDLRSEAEVAVYDEKEYTEESFQAFSDAKEVADQAYEELIEDHDEYSENEQDIVDSVADKYKDALDLLVESEELPV